MSNTSVEPTKIQQQVDFLFQHSRLPDIARRLEMIKNASTNAESIIEQNIDQLADSRKEEIRSLAMQIHQKEQLLNKSVNGFTATGQDLLNIIAEETKNYTSRAWQIRTEAERRRRTLQEKIANRHQQFESETAQYMQQCQSEIERFFDQSDMKAQDVAAQQHQQQQISSMMAMMNENNNNQQQQQGSNPNFTFMNNNNNNHNSFGGGGGGFSNSSYNNNNSNNQNHQNQNPFMLFRQ